MNLSAEAIAHHLGGRRVGPDQYRAKGICHGGDNRTTLAITQDGSDVLLYCHAGCPQEVVLDVLRGMGLWASNKETSRPAPRVKPRPEPDYTRTEGRARRAVEFSASAPGNHPYLVEKAIQPHGIGVLGGLYIDLPAPARNCGNVLVIPMQDVNGKVLSCQFIAEDGGKCYLAGPKRKGGFYFMPGNDRLWICEGFATGASLHKDTGDSVAVAFDANGLWHVTAALRALYTNIIILADDDWQTDGNPGVTNARKAADDHGLKVVVPDFTGFMRGPKDTDFNDLVRLRNGG